MNSHCFRNHREPWTVLMVLVLVSLLAGCGSPPTPVILVVTATAVPSDEAATPQEVQPCSLVTQAEAEAILGEPAAPSQDVNGACVFNNAKDSLYVVSVGAVQDKQTEAILQGQAFLLGMAGAPLDQPVLDRLKALSDAQDFKGFFAELVALAQKAPAAKAQLVDGVGDAGYWLWLTADPRRQGALIVARGPTLVNVNLVVADSQAEPAMLDASKVLADKVFSRLPARFTVPSGAAAPTETPLPTPLLATETSAPPAPTGTSAPPAPSNTPVPPTHTPTPTATATPTPSPEPPTAEPPKWARVPGGGTTDVSMAATTFSKIKTLYLFSKGIGDKRIYVNSTADGTNWTGAKEVPGGGTTDVAPAAAAFNNTLYLFGKGIGDNRIYVNSSGDGANWSGWTQVPGGGLTDVPLAATTFNGRLYLFAKGIGDNRIYVNSTADGANWSGWTRVPGGGTTDTSVAVSASNNVLYLFSKGIGDQRIYVNSTVDGANWSGWTQVPGGGTTDVAPAAVALKAGLYLFSRGIDDKRIYMNFTANGTNWTGAKEVPGGGLTESALTTSGLKGILYLFARGMDSHIYVISGIQ